MPRPLKVYRAHIGFFDTVVAAHSQKEALTLWGGAPDEFRKGFASITNDEKAVTAALEMPGVVLYRPFGSMGAFSPKKTLPKLKFKQQPKPQNQEREKHAERARARAQQKQEQEEAKSRLKAELERIAEEERELEQRRAAAKAEFAKTRKARS